jgi:hypothetical protein
MSLVIPLLVFSVVVMTRPETEVRVRRSSWLFAASCSVLLADLFFLILNVAQFATIEADLEREFWRDLF